MANNREEFGLVTINDPDPNSEAEIVVGTRDVSSSDYHGGLRFAWHVMTLYSLRGLRHVGRRLDSTGQMPYVELFSRFMDFCRTQKGSQYDDYIESTIGASEQYKFSSSGGIIHIILHTARDEFDQLLLDFMKTIPCWQDPEIRFLFEMDLFTRPHVYSNTPVTSKQDKLEFISIESVEEKGYVVKMPAAHFELAGNLLGIKLERNHCRLRIDYRLSQLPFMPAKGLDNNYSYCQDKLHKMASILPKWTLI
jgi:hypothetical protein